jgi:hypothetical protein
MRSQHTLTGWQKASKDMVQLTWVVIPVCQAGEDHQKLAALSTTNAVQQDM